MIKVAIASSLLGSPLSLTKCETSDIDIPAYAEAVIEGTVLPNIRELEGPFGETSGYYFSDQSHVIEVTAITHRKDAILQALHPTTHGVTLVANRPHNPRAWRLSMTVWAYLMVLATVATPLLQERGQNQPGQPAVRRQLESM